MTKTALFCQKNTHDNIFSYLKKRMLGTKYAFWKRQAGRLRCDPSSPLESSSSHGQQPEDFPELLVWEFGESEDQDLVFRYSQQSVQAPIVVYLTKGGFGGCNPNFRRSVLCCVEAIFCSQVLLLQCKYSSFHVLKFPASAFFRISIAILVQMTESPLWAIRCGVQQLTPSCFSCYHVCVLYHVQITR